MKFLLLAVCLGSTILSSSQNSSSANDLDLILSHAENNFEKLKLDVLSVVAGDTTFRASIIIENGFVPEISRSATNPAINIYSSTLDSGTVASARQTVRRWERIISKLPDHHFEKQKADQKDPAGDVHGTRFTGKDVTITVFYHYLSNWKIAFAHMIIAKNP